jgi:hypothetical protein
MEDSVGFEEAISGTYSNPDDKLRDLMCDEEEDENGLTGPDRARIIKEAIKRSKACHAYWDDIYLEMEKDWEYFDSKDDLQWSAEQKVKRVGKPMISLNHLPKFVAKVIAETKKHPPAIKLNARENGDKLKAELGMGIIRYIEDVSGAKYSVTHSAHCAALGGIGWMKLTFNKKKQILFKMVKNAFSYMLDPDSEEVDGSDARFIVGHTRKKSGKKIVDHYEYWWREEQEDGDAPDKVYWAIIAGQEIEEYGEFPSHIIPIFPVLGIDLQYKDERTIKGVIRDLRPAQELYNYAKSKEVELGSMVVAPLVATPAGQIPQELEGPWVKAGINLVEYSTTGDDNKPIMTVPDLSSITSPNIAWAAQLTAGAMSDMREISGIYDTALGAESKEVSGTAIMAKSEMSDAGEYIFSEHLQATLAQMGKCVVSMILPIMGEEGVVRVLGEDGKQSLVDLNIPTVDPVTGEPIKLDLDFSDMDISIGTAPAYATRREAGAQAIQDIMTAVPEYASILGDIALRNLDVPGAEEAARRVKLMLPAQLQEQDPNGAQSPEMLAQAAAQTAQQMAALQAQLAQLQQQNQSLSIELEQQNQLQMQKEILKSNTQMAIERLKLSAASQQQQAQIIADQQMAQQKIMADLAKSKEANDTQLASAVVSAAPSEPEPAPQAPWDIKAVGVLPGNDIGLQY